MTITLKLALQLALLFLLFYYAYCQLFGWQISTLSMTAAMTILPGLLQQLKQDGRCFQDLPNSEKFRRPLSRGPSHMLLAIKSNANSNAFCRILNLGAESQS
jgi:hypothetical protein